MPMTKRRRLYIPSAEKHKNKSIVKEEVNDDEMWTARGRLKGALQEVLDPTDDNSSVENSPVKRVNKARRDLNSEIIDKLTPKQWKKLNRYSSTDEVVDSYPRQPFVMKLFDRNVDLSQFSENSPLYPICRAWIANQPKANYSVMGKSERKIHDDTELDGVDLPLPEGPLVARVPNLLPVQKKASKDNVNSQLMNNKPILSRDELLNEHISRWLEVRRNWLDQAAKRETRYANTQEILNQINTNC